ncbi:winged helix-turn-helix domain-containing protein [Shewanella sp. JM162201]|uniref:Winged helix-turn-helix domain-containing protein n=1 Tax=Shewanella jiangmenensis TaxID=2837387 RepID=A0ABS5V320_9GAMM|nr:winged helix-turn-helix domain-containing protein [Shewanella jiangmenensis]MBT1444079.1 winged helix-turn-helix domain-containing protein [Shewanella jiangmenensis]
MTDNIFFFGDWQISPQSNRLSRGSINRQLEPKAMEVLLYLCHRAGEVVSSDELLDACWPGLDTGDNPLHKTIAQLRRALDDSATTPQFIETIRRRGYRTLAQVNFPVGHEESAPEQAWQSGSPFPGLRAFGEADAGVFFGRREQINALLDNISRQLRTGRGFCLLLGPSGSGKTSLIHAGVLPNLMTPQGVNGIGVVSASGLDLADVGRGQLYSALAGAMLDWEVNDTPVFQGHSMASLAAVLEQDASSLYGQLLGALPGSPWDKPRFALVIDRLEVLLSSPLFSANERDAFLALMDSLSRSGAVLLLSACRNDFYPQVVSQPSLMAGKGNGAHFDLEPPSRQALLQMIRLPAAAAGLSWEFDAQSALGLDEILCREASASPDALPMLQYLLQVLYLERDGQNQLKLDVYHRLGGIEGAIGRAADEALASESDATRRALPTLLARLVTLREDELSITSRSARYSELVTDAERQLVQALVDSRLFVSHLEDAEPSFSVAHEALLRRWQRAASWIEAHRQHLALQARIFHQANRWQQGGRERDYLLGEGKPLLEARQLLDEPVLRLDDISRDFIAASCARAARRSLLKRGTVALLAVLTLVSVLMGISSMRAERLATERRLAAEDLLGFMVGQFADRLRSIGRMDLLDGVSNKALDYFSTEDRSLSAAALLRHGQTLEAMGEVAYSREKPDEARAALLAARSKLLPLVGDDVPQLELHKTLGANAFWLGQIEYDRSDWAATKPWFTAYLEHSEAMLALAPESRDAMLELSYAENSLGSLAMKQQDYGRAREMFEASLALKQILLSANPGDGQLLADVADTQSWLASAALAQGDVKKALALYHDIGAVLGVTKEAYALDRLSHSQVKLARLHQWLGDSEAAKAALERALKTRSDALSGDPDNLSWRYDLLTLKIQGLELGLAAASSAELAVFEAELNHSAAPLPGERQQRLQQLYLLSAAKRLYKLGDFAGAEARAAAAMAAFKLVNLAASADVNDSVKWAEVQLLWRASRRAQGMELPDTELCLQAKQLLLPLAGASNEPKITLPLVQALECLGETEQATRLKAPLLAQGVVFDNLH